MATVPLMMLYPSYSKLQVRWLRSFTRITYLSKLIGIHSLAALQGSMSLALTGQRVALFNTQCVLSCNSNYLGYISLSLNHRGYNSISQIIHVVVCWKHAATDVLFACIGYQ
ncbi:hypothetical protein Dd1591_1312 [Dickeya chrysanthemi Ech1591]|uniref:Uncharacterized protein n=1 Tax=Dickeya chrysanthemi (strain Ech1591) TaxID=561229 RepID=C6CQI2_DICC1|nr:hypothetical protein Dd1591_1312 [Dickeya chrysanthemi Ech1591]